MQRFECHIYARRIDNDTEVRKLKFMTLLIAGVALTGCVTPISYVKPGASEAQTADDSFECKLAAAERVPVRQEIYSQPGVVFSTGAVLPAQVYSEDANYDLREEFFQRCMINRGYRVQ